MTDEITLEYLQNLEAPPTYDEMLNDLQYQASVLRTAQKTIIALDEDFTEDQTFALLAATDEKLKILQRAASRLIALKLSIDAYHKNLPVIPDELRPLVN